MAGRPKKIKELSRRFRRYTVGFTKYEDDLLDELCKYLGKKKGDLIIEGLNELRGKYKNQIDIAKSNEYYEKMGDNPDKYKWIFDKNGE